MLSTPYIDGKAIEVSASAMADVLNPANQKPFARNFMAQEQHMRAAIDAAHTARTSWAQFTRRLARKNSASSRRRTRSCHQRYRGFADRRGRLDIRQSPFRSAVRREHVALDRRRSAPRAGRRFSFRRFRPPLPSDPPPARGRRRHLPIQFSRGARAKKGRVRSGHR